jgi:hypothetical protein
MKRSLSVTRQSVKSSGYPVTFKTQGESFNMSKLVEETLLKPDFIKHIVPPLFDMFFYLVILIFETFDFILLFIN